MARLIRTEKEVEGRDSEIWTLADEEPLDQWPAGTLAVVGRPAARIDGLARARGEATYTADVALPGQLETALLVSPHARARVRSLDLAAARGAPGVRAVLGPDDSDALTREPGHHGHPVAAVAADTGDAARAALALVEVDWEVLEPLLDADEAVRRGSLVSESQLYERGDADRGLADADAVVEGEFRTQTVLHNPFETHQAVCHWEGEGLVAYVSTQFIWGVRKLLAERFRLHPDAVRVVCRYMGGGFGAKNGPGYHTFLAAELARATGRPVRCALTRRQANLDSGNRNATVQRLAVAARADGTLTALTGEFVNAVGSAGFVMPTAGPMHMFYACENVRTLMHGARVNTSPNAAFRAPGFPEGTFPLESLLDELAARLDLDPLELRRRNLPDGDPLSERPFTAGGLAECYRRAERHWARRAEVRARSQGPWRHGMGLSSQVWFGGGGPPSHAWVRLACDGSATVVTAMQDIGTGTRTAMAQIAAEELGLPLERVRVTLGDSSAGPYATISAGSSTLAAMGPAVRAAAADAARQVREVAAQRLGCGAGDVELADGRVVVGDAYSRPIEDVLGPLGDTHILGKGSRGPNPAGMRYLTFGVQLAEVAVDVETGEVRVDRVVAIHDVGRIVNPLGAASQVEGGVVQAIGHTLSEGRLLDPASGRVLTQTLDAYRLPTIADVPEIVVELVDEPDRNFTNLGAKGLGEPPIIPTAAAIGNAIRDATGARVHALPITREEMLRALREAREREQVGARPAG